MRKYIFMVMITFILFSSCAVSKEVANNNQDGEDLISQYLASLVEEHNGIIQSGKAYTVSGSNDFLVEVILNEPSEKDIVIPLAENIAFYLKEDEVYEYIQSFHNGLGYINISFIYEQDRSKESRIYYCHSFSINDPTADDEWTMDYELIELE